MYDDYMEMVKTYRSYGIKTVVFFQVGSFYEIYAVEQAERETLQAVCSLLNIQLTRKNKSIVEISPSNYQLAGLPVASSPKHIDVLIKEGWTVVLVDQVGEAPNIQRVVSQVLSPSTYLEVTSSDSRYLMCVYLTVRPRTGQHVFTVAYTDVSTGATYVINEEIETDDVISDLTRYLTSYSPKEIVFISSDLPIATMTRLRVWFRTLVMAVQDRLENIPPSFLRLAYQTAVLKKTYPNTGLLSPIEFVGLERNPDSVLTLVYLFQFVYEHNETLLQHIQPPHLIYPHHHMHVSHGSLDQLNILGKTDSVLHAMNTCATPMGRRLFAHRLATPITDATLLRERYDRVDGLMDTHLDLSPIKDLERMHRRLQLGKLTTAELLVLLSSVEHIQDVHDAVPTFPMSDSLQTALDVWHHESLLWNKDTKNEMDVYPVGRFPDMDALKTELDALHQKFTEVVTKANRIIDDGLKMDVNDRWEYTFTMTKKRFETYGATRKMNSPVLTAHPISAQNKTMVRISFPDMDTYQHRITECYETIRETVATQFRLDMERYAQDMSLVRLAAWVAELDVAYTCAVHARSHHYVRPDVHTGPCFIDATEVRHPLIERLLKDVPYVANDVSLGNDTNGLLLYGINFSGKSSYMKSVGVNLLLAQAGMFVAATSFRYSPYDHLFTRIPSGDNMFKGQSTFVVEMNELRAILKQSTNRSLVIGDEIASGTETVSGISIVASGILSLATRGTSFLFATHLHEVADLECVRALTHVRLGHMSVHYDEHTGVLVYDRILRPGTGDTLYGLEVCQSLDMPAAFLLDANRIRQSYLNMSPTVVATKRSSYDATVHVDVCTMCQQPAAEVHHIQEQHKADEKGMIGRMHKNARHNLMVVCTACHDRIHHQHVLVRGYSMTNAGIRLMMDDSIVSLSPVNSPTHRVKELRDQGKSLQTIATETGRSVYHVRKLLSAGSASDNRDNR